MRRIVVAAAVALACLGSGLGSLPTPDARAARSGGTLRIGANHESLYFFSSFDPVNEVGSMAGVLQTNLILRTLVTHRHVEGAAGTEVVADLATEVPTPTNDGRTYTFRLKRGVRFGPPVNRRITSRDIKYAFARIKCRPCSYRYLDLYTRLIKGMRPLTPRPEPKSISGIETPNDRTIVFHLTQASGDFLQRLTFPAAAPVPREVARCRYRSGRYGEFVIASGPYMLEGSEDLDISSCRTMKPIEGYREYRHLRLVRNPNYDPGTDDPSVRSSHPDRIFVEGYSRDRAIFRRIEDGRLDLGFARPRLSRIRRYLADPELRDNLQVNRSSYGNAIMMNLTQPPFDDVRVRRAVNLVLDKAALYEAWGPETGELATHVIPDFLTGGHPTSAEYDPYATPEHHGDVNAAREEMSASSYDSDGDGLCDSSDCENVYAISWPPFRGPQWPKINQILIDDLAKIGIQLDLHEDTNADAVYQVAKAVPITPLGSLFTWFPDPFHQMKDETTTAAIDCNYNRNFSLIGATPETKEECGVSIGDFENVPSVDDDLAGCRPLVGEERNECWRRFDRTLMEEVVPWVPYRWEKVFRITGGRIADYEFDQAHDEMSLAHIRLKR
jgi:peptide/nickel transport system substrate-binding protein